MTLFRLDSSAGPGTHAFVIGVGQYPYLDGGSMQSANTRGFGQLTSPPISALAMVDWFDQRMRNPGAPLKSLEVLISQARGPARYTDAAGFTSDIEEANWENFEKAARRWYDQTDRDANNVAVFYFCGHGSGDGVNTSLLMSDTGGSPTFLRQALHLPGFRMAVSASKAQKQIFYIDACRTVDLASLLHPHDIASPGLQSNVVRVFSGANPVLHSARQGEPAFGTPGQVSDFTAALLEGLNRFGVFRQRGQSWVVQPQELQKAVAALMDDFSGRQQCQADGISGVGFALHVLSTTPEVVMHVSVGNPAARDSAVITCQANDTISVRRNTDHPWRTFMPAGQCDVSASFVPPSPYTSTLLTLPVFPPFQDVELEVQ